VSPADDRYAEPNRAEAADAPAGPNLIAATLRRWPIVLLGVGFGLVLGLLVYVQSTRQYQSGAQLLINKRQGILNQQLGSQFAILEDYVGTQVTLIRSESVLRSAAVSIDKGQLHLDTWPTPLPDDETGRIGFLGRELTVQRDKEGIAGSMGSNVLNLSFRCPNAQDAAYILKTVIERYKNELEVVFEGETKNQVDKLSQYITGREKDLASNAAQLAEKERLKREESLEEYQTIQQRYSDLGRQLAMANSKFKEAEFDLGIIADVGPGVQARQEAAAALNIKLRGVDINSENFNSIQNLLEQARFKFDQVKKRYGKDHPQYIDAQNQVEYLERLNKRLNPGAESEVFIDDLARLKKFREKEKKFQGELMVLLETAMKKDLAQGSRIGVLASEIQALKEAQQRINLDITENKDKRNKLDVAKLSGGYDAKVITNPGNGAQVAPSLTRTMALFLLLGTLAGVGLAVVVELTDKSFRTPAEIRRRLGLPVIGHIPPIRTGLPSDRSTGEMEPIVVSHLRPKSTEAEAYRGVRTSLYFSTQGRGHQVVQVTSPNPGDGKSTLAANLAVSVAQSGKRVVLIDCDFRKPRVHKIFHIDKPEVGLASIITGESTTVAAVRPTAVDNLFILPCGPRPANPAELLTSPEFQAVIDKLRAEYEFVIIDTPPVLAVSDPLVVAPRVDGVLLVFRMTKKARPTAERAREQLGAVGANVLGVVVNGTGQKRDDYYGYGYGYNYGYGYQYQYQNEYEYADDYSDDEPSSHDVMPLERAEVPAKG